MPGKRMKGSEEDAVVSACKRSMNLSLLVLILAYPCGCNASISSNEPSNCRRRSRSQPDSNHNLRHFQIEDMTEDECLNLDQRHGVAIVGSGREFNLFDLVPPRGGDAFEKRYTWNNPASISSSSPSPSFQRKSSSRRKNGRSGGRSSSIRSNTAFSLNNTSKRPSSSSNLFQSFRDWVAAGNLPSIQCRVEPNTTLKVRKTFRPLKTIIRLGADFNTQLGVWQFRSSWEDALIGGKLTLAGRELQFTKTWLLSVGAVEDLVTRLRFRAAVDLGTMKAYARLGFRTERLSPINVVEGFTLMKQLPLDGTNGHVKLEVKANFAFPEPEIEYSTENHRSVIGMGDIKISVDELNLLLDY